MIALPNSQKDCPAYLEILVYRRPPDLCCQRPPEHVRHSFPPGRRDDALLPLGEASERE